MTSRTQAVFIAVLIAAPVVSFAQSSQPLTRAQVRAELTEVEKAGYDTHDWVHYPENIQAAENKVVAQNAAAEGSNSGVGGVVDGANRSGQAHHQ
jgi:hypothetical protein